MAADYFYRKILIGSDATDSEQEKKSKTDGQTNGQQKRRALLMPESIKSEYRTTRVNRARGDAYSALLWPNLDRRRIAPCPSLPALPETCQKVQSARDLCGVRVAVLFVDCLTCLIFSWVSIFFVVSR